MQQTIAQKNDTTKTIRISNLTYEQLLKMGTLQDTFDSVIQSLLKVEAKLEK